MDSLNPRPDWRIGDRLGLTLGYRHRLTTRMSRVGLDIREPQLYPLVRAAEDAMHGLCVELHFQSCGHGVGRSAAPVTNPDPH